MKIEKPREKTHFNFFGFVLMLILLSVGLYFLIHLKTPKISFSPKNSDTLFSPCSVDNFSEYSFNSKFSGHSAVFRVFCSDDSCVNSTTGERYDCVISSVVDIDLDDDGFMGCYSGGTKCDCDDNNPKINPNLKEVCFNGVDDNCNWKIDEGC